MYEIKGGMSLGEKLQILSDAAKYDVACTSSGVDRRGKEGSLGNSCSSGICHAFAADGRCISLLKILMTNHCAYDCKYCKNRVSNDIPRATFSPEEICTLTIEFYKRNYIEGLFLSSGILGTPDYTMEKICRALRMLRSDYKFNGYIHVKAIPGASPELLYSAGLLADRVSINMELPTADGLSMLAPNKSMSGILTPMGQISQTISDHRVAIGKDAKMERAVINRHLSGTIFDDENREREITASESGILIPGGRNSTYTQSFGTHLRKKKLLDNDEAAQTKQRDSTAGTDIIKPQYKGLVNPAEQKDLDLKRPFAPAGQSTQMIIGATGETDFDLVRTTEQLYKSYDLKRVFFSGYIPLNEDSHLPSLDTPVPLVREHRLYQADWLLRFYGFHANELLSEERPDFTEGIDPKCDWAIRNLDRFPIEVNTASYDELIRVPGIGPTGVKKIMSARKYSHITFEMLRKMHIVLKRAQFFITCGGRMLYSIPIEQQFILHQLTDLDKQELMQLQGETVSYKQMNLFSDFGVGKAMSQ